MFYCMKDRSKLRNLGLEAAIEVRKAEVPEVEIEVYFDFASCVCFAAHQVMRRIEDQLLERSIVCLWRPIDLTRLTDWRRGDRYEGHRLKRVRSVCDELKVSLVPPRAWPDSRLASEWLLAMSEQPERAAAFRHAVFAGVYQDAQPIEEPSFLEECAGGPPPRTCPDFSGLKDETRSATAAGVVGVPAFMLGGFPVGGIQDEQTMLDFLTRYAKRARTQAPAAVQ